MKKVLLILAVLMVSLVGLTAIVGAQGADVASDIGCGVSFPGYGGLGTTDSHAVMTPSGNVVLTCQFTHDFDVEGGAVIIRNNPCGTPWGIANRAQKVLSPGGQATLTCWVNPAGS